MAFPMRFGRHGFIAASLGVLLTFGAHAQDAPIPALTARVTDGASLLSPDQRNALEATLADYETRKGTQIAVLTVLSTAPEGIEQYGIRVADAWKIGRKGTADGVILIVAKNNPPDLRRLRIEVGKGLEGAIPDAVAKRIIDENIAPHFRQGDFYGGLVAGVERIEGSLENEALPAPTSMVDAFTSGGPYNGFGLALMLMLFVVAMIVQVIRSRKTGYVAGNRAINGSSGSSLGTSLLGLAANIVVSGLAARGGGGGGGSGGGSSGGGFSGGGGDFGGGGASGDW